MNEEKMKVFSVCYDKFCLGRFSLTCDEQGNIVLCEGLGAFESYLLGMWNDGMVVTMKVYDEATDGNLFVLLLPDGSEQLMTYSRENGFVVEHYRELGGGRFAYLLNFLKGFEYKGFRGYEEYDEEEALIGGVVLVGEESLTYSGRDFTEARKDFERTIENYTLGKD